MTLTIQHRAGTAPPPTPPSITTTSPLPQATVGTAYAVTFAASGGTTPYTWTASGLPAWATLSTAGVLTGTPTTSGTPPSFTVTVTDSASQTAIGTFSITVVAVPVTPPNLGNLTHGQVLTLSLPSALASFGTKKAQTPDVWDHGQDGPGVVSSQWSAYSPYAATGALAYVNMQNRRLPWTPPGNLAVIQQPDPYTNIGLGANHYAYFNEPLPGGGYPGNIADGYLQSVGVCHFWQPQTLGLPTNIVYGVTEWYLAFNPDIWWKSSCSQYGPFSGNVTAGATTITGVSAAACREVAMMSPYGDCSFYYPSDFSAVNIVSTDPVAGTITLNAGAPSTQSGNVFTAYNSGNDNNTKTWDLSEGTATGRIYDSPNGTYESVQLPSGSAPINRVVANSSQGNVAYQYYTSTSRWRNNFAAALPRQPFDPNIAGYGTMQNWPNPADPRTLLNGNARGGWIKMTCISAWDSGANGWRRVYANDLFCMQVGPGRTMFNPLPTAPTGVLEAIGGYWRNSGIGQQTPFTNSNLTARQRNQWEFYANLRMDLQSSGCGRIVLTNDANWYQGSGTWSETQFGWTAWSANSITLTLQVGNVNPGACYLFYVDEAHSIGATLVASGTIVAGTLAAAFDYYIGPSGSNTNAGTQAAPWALTSLLQSGMSGYNATIAANQALMAGKRIGVLPGTYNCATLVGGTYNSDASGQSFGRPAFIIPPGTAIDKPTVLQSTTPRGAILDGGMTDTNNPGLQPLIGSQSNGTGQYVILDGFEIRNANDRLVSMGGTNGAGMTTRVSGVVIRNNWVHGITSTYAAGGNSCGITLYAADGAIIYNNRVDTIQNSVNRIVGIETWSSINTVIRNNTIIVSSSGAAGIYIKNAAQYNVQICYNYVNCSGAGASVGQQGLVAWDLQGTSSNVSSAFNNVIVGDAPFMCNIAGVNMPACVEQQRIYNNTFVGTTNWANVGMQAWGAAGTLMLYNNIYSRGTVGYRGDINVNVSTLWLSDYNCLPSNPAYGLTTDGGTGGPTTYNAATIAAALPAGCIGKEAHSTYNSTPLFTGTGTDAAQWKLQSGSPFVGKGAMYMPNGQVMLGACDPGAWGAPMWATTTQVGSNF